jgi:hypothetical protein
VSVTLAEFKADEYRGLGDRIAFVSNGGSHSQLLREYDGDIFSYALQEKYSCHGGHFVWLLDPRARSKEILGTVLGRHLFPKPTDFFAPTN